MRPSEYAKATVGAVLAGLTALGTALADGTVTAAEWVGVAVAVLATGGTVFGVRNQRGTHRRTEGGAVSTEAILTTAAGVFLGGLLLWLLARAVGWA